MRQCEAAPLVSEAGLTVTDEVLGDFTLTILKRDGMMLEGWYFKQDRINNDTGRNVRFTGQVTGDQLHIESDNELAPFEADGGIVEGVLALDFTATRTGGEFKMKAKIPPSISSPTLATTDVIEGMTGATTGMFLNPQASDNLGGPSEVPGSSADESMDENAQESQGKSTKLSLEEKDQKQIDLAISKYEESSMAADAVLLAAIDREIENVRKQPRLTGEQQQQLIDALGVEKATFEQHRTIPFSPRMRAAANVWVNNIEKARIPAAKTYDKVIGRLTRAKEDEEAAQRQDEKQRLVGPKVIGVWDCKHYTLDKISYRLYLYSNHQAKTVYESELPSMNRTWKLDNDQLIIELIVQAGSPIPTFGLDACDIAPSGQTLSGVDLKDGGKRKFNASRVDE